MSPPCHFQAFGPGRGERPPAGHDLRLWPEYRHTESIKETSEMDQAKLNTDPPIVRCRMCGGRCRSDGAGFPRWIYCARCSWSSHDPRRTGLVWRLRVWIGR